MKLGLKSKLNIFILDKGYATLDEVYAFAQSLGFKQKTAERELNPSHSPDIETIKNAKGQIQGYKHRRTPNLPQGGTKGCCTDMDNFGKHFDRPCVNLQVTKTNQLNF
jgi:hypothetical protein